MGNMAQATVLYDVADRPVFTIFKEQRIEVPLAQMSPNLVERGALGRGPALLPARGVDVDPHHGRRARERAERAPGARRVSTITQQLARQSFLTLERPPPQDQGSAPRRAASSGPIEGGDPRALSQQGLLRRRIPRRRSGGARLLRQARLGADASRKRHCWPASSSRRRRTRRPSTWTRRSPAATSCWRRCSRTARSIGPSSTAPARRRCTLHERPAARRGVRPVLQGAGAARAGRPLRLAACRQRRAARLHHHRSGDAAGGRAERSRPVCRRSRSAKRLQARDARRTRRRGGSTRTVSGRLSAGRCRRHGSATGRSAGDGRRPQLHREPLQPRRSRRGASPAPRSSRSSTPRRSKPA